MGLRHKLAKALRFLNPVAWARRWYDLEKGQQEHGARLASLEQASTVLAADIAALSAGIGAVQGETERIRDERIPYLERRLDQLEQNHRAAERAVDAGLNRIDRLEDALRVSDEELQRLRDGVVPAMAARENALFDRLAEQLEEQASMLERMLRGEPLPVPESGSDEEKRLVAALAAVSSVAGGADEHDQPPGRFVEVVERLRGCDPVLDLCAGSGALMLELHRSGVRVAGIESDPARAAAARRRGLEVDDTNLLEALASRPDGCFAAAVGLHLAERLGAGSLLEVLGQVHRVVRPSGLLVLRILNTANLRVASSLIWRDARNLRPVATETLRTCLVASGFEVQEMALVDPFPIQEWVVGPAEAGEPHPVQARLAAAWERLHGLLDGPRAVLVSARRSG